MSILLIGLYSCSDEENQLIEPNLSKVNFDYSIKNGSLIFPTENDFESAINYLAENNNERFINEDTFTSYLDVNTDTEIDNIFAALISNDQKIIVAGYEFFIDFM
ncbi:MAG: hypothetical protein MI921_29265 [Cytophagales bacterium]|nr:hypothetical protein [Cytophagales bacterium]